MQRVNHHFAASNGQYGSQSPFDTLVETELSDADMARLFGFNSQGPATGNMLSRPSWQPVKHQIFAAINGIVWAAEFSAGLWPILDGQCGLESVDQRCFGASVQVKTGKSYISVV
jgi:hypothetical protein